MTLTEILLAELEREVPRSRRALEQVPPDLDIAPADGSSFTSLDASAADARAALRGTTDDHLHTTWQLKARGQVVAEAPRHEMIQDALNHWAHHRGQMTVYLRLLGAKVPALYGPSADDKNFG